MAWPKEREHIEYLKYVEQWSTGEGEFSDQPKMSKEEWRKRMGGDEEKPKPSSSRRSSIMVGSE